MSDLKPRLSADRSLYDAADAALRALRLDLIQRAEGAGDYRMVVDFGERLLRYGCNSIAKASSLPNAAEHAYRAADDIVATSMNGGVR